MTVLMHEVDSVDFQVQDSVLAYRTELDSSIQSGSNRTK